VIEQWIVAFSLGRPGAGPDRIACELAGPKWDGIVASAKGVWRALRSHATAGGALVVGVLGTAEAPDEGAKRSPDGIGTGPQQ
jgi:hypothetical protein